MRKRIGTVVVGAAATLVVLGGMSPSYAYERVVGKCMTGGAGHDAECICIDKILWGADPAVLCVVG